MVSELCFVCGAYRVGNFDDVCAAAMIMQHEGSAQPTFLKLIDFGNARFLKYDSRDDDEPEGIICFLLSSTLRPK